MKILLTGAGGQLGQDCQKILTGHKLISCDRQRLDIGDATAVNTLLQEERPEVIINCAAYTAVDRCETEKDLAWRVNATGPENLAKGAAALGARLLHISTDYVFDGSKPIPESYQESDPTNPLSEYGRSKLAGEEAVLTHLKDAVILRTAWLYSANGGNFLKTMLRLTTANPKRELKVVNDQYGSLTWSFFLARQLENLLDSEITGIVHATAGGSSTWYQAACHFLTLMGQPYNIRPCTTDEYPTPAHRPANSILENRVLQENSCDLFPQWQKQLDQFVSVHGDNLRKELQGADQSS